jgi:hypothetical protein
MANLRLSTAKYQYSCSKCSGTINKGRPYYRLEPFPIARIKGIEKVQQLCLACVQGEESDEVRQERQDWLKYYWVGGIEARRLQIFSPEHEEITLVNTEVHIVNITTEVLHALGANPNEIFRLTSEAFEVLICDRLQAMNYGVQRIGHSFQKDGGIDIVAWPQKTEFPFLLAIQAKHHRSPQYKTGPGPVRELVGVIQTHPFHAGVLVTNTTFTPDAKWVADQNSSLVRLRDIQDIQRWLENEFLDEYNWQEIPDQITVCPGVTIHLPRSKNINYRLR